MKLKNCRVCNYETLNKAISLGYQKNTSIFPIYGITITKKYPIDLYLCKNCSLLQLDETTPSYEMYETGGYGYRSSISNTMMNHLTQYNKELISKIILNSDDVVVDIGSNDAFTLKLYDNSLRRIGIDPTGKQFEQFYTDNIELLPTYFTLQNFIEKFGKIRVKVVTSIAMFYDLPDPVQFAKDIYQILDIDGIWSCEQSYLLHMLDTNSIDTICHEHLEYYSLKQIKIIADKSNFKIIDVKFNDCNGGSFRIYFSKKESNVYNEASELINQIFQNEDTYNLSELTTYSNFVKRCDNELNKLTNFIEYVNSNNKTIQIYGASTKGNCVLQYCNITEEKVKYAVERNPSKVGCSTSTGIKIISEEIMRQSPPDYLIILPWHFKNEIVERETEYLKNGGKMIFYFPFFEIISYKPKLLITGCDGFISKYIKETYNAYELYGITRSALNVEENILKIQFDMNNFDKLEEVIKTINPKIIIHLASTSSSISAYHTPFNTLYNNGILTAKICDIILNYNKNIILFNASSSEMYKGHGTYHVNEENNDNTNHIHPYSIAKIMGHNIVKFYRETYKLNFSNGIIFTTQSAKKKNTFLLNKIHSHLKSNKDFKLKVGNLSSYRNIIHPYDVSSAIKLIIDINNGDDYLICNYDSYKIEELVIKIYQNFNIQLIKYENKNAYYNKNTNEELLIVQDEEMDGLDKIHINISAYPQKLRELGWEIKYDINKIMDEFN
jgi:GDP-D-mannose dehydratase